MLQDQERGLETGIRGGGVCSWLGWQPHFCDELETDREVRSVCLVYMEWGSYRRSRAVRAVRVEIAAATAVPPSGRISFALCDLYLCVCVFVCVCLCVCVRVCVRVCVCVCV